MLTLSDASEAVVDTFSTPVDPSDAQLYLVVSEIMYHPADPDGDSEFIELMNISDSVTLDLGGVQFTAGIDFAFPVGTMLPPGARTVVNFSQFQNNSRLSNGSERIKLEDASSSTIRDFSYDDDAPWPTDADGAGFSLVLINPASNPDHGDPVSWRASTTAGGHPGTSDAVHFSGNPNEDLDGDGMVALLEHALSTSDSSPNPTPVSVTSRAESISVSILTNHGADDVTLVLESSPDLVTWTGPAPDFSLTSSTNNGDGTTTLTFESTPGFKVGNGSHFVRVRAELLSP